MVEAASKRRITLDKIEGALLQESSSELKKLLLVQSPGIAGVVKQLASYLQRLNNLTAINRQTQEKINQRFLASLQINRIAWD